jgi:hypothetical protein
MNLFAWIEALPVSQSILTSIWLHPFLLAGHSVGMGIVVGIIFMLNLRVLGYLSGIPVETFGRLIWLGWAGFILNLLTGVLMFMAFAHTLATNWTFQFKMVFIVLGGISLLLLSRSVKSAAADDGSVFASYARALAIASLIFWTGAVAMGRLIAYTAPEGV